MMKVAALIVSLFIVVQCTTTPEPATTNPTSKSPTVVPGSSTEPSDPTTRRPHTHDEHPPNDPDHSDHPGHEEDPKTVEKTKDELDHHKDHGHDHVHDHDKEDSKLEEKTKTVEESKEDHEKRFQRDILRRRFD